MGAGLEGCGARGSGAGGCAGAGGGVPGGGLWGVALLGRVDACFFQVGSQLRGEWQCGGVPEYHGCRAAGVFAQQ